MLSDSVGLALLVVLEKLEPVERLAFVLHDLFRIDVVEILACASCSCAILTGTLRSFRGDEWMWRN
jgi:hypothetical protein